MSIVVPNYNHAKYLQQRLLSLLQQTHSEFEGILLDDASTDDSVSHLTSIVSSDYRFNLFLNTENSGSAFAQWNKGVSIAKEDIVWVAESDDMAKSNLVAKLLEKISSDPEIVLAYCQSLSINNEGDVIGNWHDYTVDLDAAGKYLNDFVMDGKEYIRHFLIHRNTIPNASAVIFRKSYFEKVGGAPIHLKTNGDWLTWLKMLCFGKIAFISEPMNYFRKHDESVIAQAHKIDDEYEYRERYDTTLRMEFSSFLKQNNISISKDVLQTNQYYMSLDKGNKGLFNLKNGYFLRGWKDVMAASFYPRVQSGFIKKALGFR